MQTIRLLSVLQWQNQQSFLIPTLNLKKVKFDNDESTQESIAYDWLLSDTYNCGLSMLRECRERFSCNWLQPKLLVNDPSIHHGVCVTHVSGCMSGSLTFPAFPAHAQPAILRIWQEAHARLFSTSLCVGVANPIPTFPLFSHVMFEL